MNQLFHIAALVSLLLTAPAAMTAEPRARLQWQNVPQEAVTMARQKQRPLLIYVTTNYCGYCRQLERTTWSHSEVAERIEKDFVPLKLDAEAYPRLVASLGVRGYPTVVVVSQEGRELGRINGFVEPHRMLGHLQNEHQNPPCS